ncbi:two component transcriptional regulator, LuxR family [Salinimicrobium sediminis]|uniref:Two component transcriptional regulator, LuxR family n=1 Tax=Salinimicrobium sediminis TaxID=1343891 RepID=A0A285X3G6_9FLAO|nr:DNA-binding response regulator [Salinimicrobium sediminis]MDX1753579.1 DNA-binding response regulator [Salinimicrobium sediminis]SOC79901.1 two component transcriptional regulator, LuxR family [Salinimicrobium sediminis]
MKINILIIEDEILVAENISYILQKHTDCDITIVDNEEDALLIFKKEPVDLIISDIHLNNSHDGTCVVKKIQQERYVPVIYVTAYSDKNYLDAALETEPVTYLIKPFLERQLLVAFSIALNKVEKNRLEDSIVKPSARELQIIELLIKGFNSRDIGNFLFLSEHTIKTQRKNMLRKYKVNSTYELIALSSRLKWIKND